MKRLILIAVVTLLAPLAANTQWNFMPTPNDTLHSVQVLPDGKVAVRIYAPQAESVSLGGDVWTMKPFVKADLGRDVVPPGFKGFIAASGIHHHLVTAFVFEGHGDCAKAVS